MHLPKRQDSELTSPSLSLDFSKEIQAELSFWEQFRFSFDMSDGSSSESPSSSLTSDTQRAREPEGNHGIDAQDAALLAQFTARAGLSSHDSSITDSIESLLAQGTSSSSSGLNNHPFIHDVVHSQAESPPLSSSEFLWNLFLSQYHQTHLDQVSLVQRDASAASSSSHPYDELSLLLRDANPAENPAFPSRHSSTSATEIASVSASESTSESTTTEFDRTLMAEEKRRRNTEASARFRVKRKQRTLNLERTVNDLTGRAEDLERQVADLRRENGWLKEIIVLKGSRLAVANLASHIMEESTQRAAEESLRTGEHESSDSSDPGASTSKRKGKSRRK